ncbi:glycerophosphodiester phosphodiesterase [Aquimarina pacifica]|uniref:glycerophosphodiester phosphodiesterase n=1 Tax=Aquimarina pacifica TaxID=1296415 RepID=UPI0004721B4B|nr:glycerophosphodiester phosphodiesterase family protein [Aquimarina pacifica]
MKIFGHRGAAGLAAENTLESIMAALLYHVDGIEIDVHCCKSGELVVIHDETIDRTTNGIGPVSDYTLEELQGYRTKEGFLIPTLREVLDIVNAQCILNIELKGEGTGVPLIKLLREYVLKTNWEYHHFIVSSFDHEQLLTVKSLTSNLRLGVLTEENITSVLDIAKEMRAYSIHPPIISLNQEEINSAKGLGYKVYVWTVNSALLIRKSKSWSIDGIITDFPNFA